MKRILTLFVCLIITVIFLSPVTFADELNESYNEILKNSNADEFFNELPDETQELLDGLGIDFTEFNSINNLTFKKALDTFLEILGNKKSGAMQFGIVIITFSLISAAFSGLFETRLNKSFTTFEYISVCMILGSVFYLILDFINLLDKSVSLFSSIITVFVPIFCGILIALGRTASATTVSLGLFTMAQIITQIISVLVIPLIKLSFSFGLCSAVSSEINVKKTVDLFRKTASYILTFCLSVFLFVFGSQSVISVASDNAVSKTAKFIVGSTVPIVGATVSESLTIVKSCFNILKSSFAVYGIFSIILIFAPIILQTIIWKLTILVTETVVEITDNKSVLVLTENINKTLSFFLVIIISLIILFIFTVSIISLGVA